MLPPDIVQASEGLPPRLGTDEGGSWLASTQLDVLHSGLAVNQWSSSSCALSKTGSKVCGSFPIAKIINPVSVKQPIGSTSQAGSSTPDDRSWPSILGQKIAGCSEQRLQWAIPGWTGGLEWKVMNNVQGVSKVGGNGLCLVLFVTHFSKFFYFVQHFLFFCKSSLSSHLRHLFLPCSNVIPILFTSTLVIQWFASTFSCASLSCHVPASWHRTNNPAFRLSKEENLRWIGFSIKLDGQFTLMVHCLFVFVVDCYFKDLNQESKPPGPILQVWHLRPALSFYNAQQKTFVAMSVPVVLQDSVLMWPTYSPLQETLIQSRPCNLFLFPCFLFRA